MSSRPMLRANISLPADRLAPAAASTGASLEPPPRDSARSALTPRERDVVRGVIAGLTNKEMARDLGVKEQAIKNVLSAVFYKCRVRNRLELALFAVQHHLGDD